MKKTLIILLTCCMGAYAAEKKFYAHGPASKMEFALTYDDGPGLVTEDLLAVLKMRGAPATFFILGENAAKYPGKLRKIEAEGHLLGNHTYSHRDFPKLAGQEDRESVLEEELLKTAAQFEKAGVKAPVLARLPNGYCKKWALTVLSRLGYTAVNWSYGADWKSIPEGEMTEAYIEALRPGAIILLHDAGGKSRQKTLRITEALLLEAAKKGLKPVRLDDLLGLRRKEEKGKEGAAGKIGPDLKSPRNEQDAPVGKETEKQKGE